MSGDNGILRVRRRMLNTEVTAATAPAQTAQVNRAQWSARRMKRDAALLRAVKSVDTAPSHDAQREVSAWLREVYENRGGGVLVGLFGHCYLGPPYIDHACDLTGSIMEHYAPTDSVPSLYQPARPYAVSTAYSFIEIYADGQIVPIRPDGSAVV